MTDSAAANGESLAASTRSSFTAQGGPSGSNGKPANLKRVVVIGGGTGTFAVLRGLRDFDLEVSAVVSVMDDGGSSGRLRDEFGYLPPGDLRRCLVALSADDETGMLMRKLFEYRFDRGAGLEGHAFGNLFITALAGITGGLEGAIAAATRLLNVRGRVIPVTLDDVRLCAELADGSVIRGESAIDIRTEKPGVPIGRIFLDRPACPNPAAIEAIAAADLLVIGPGDLYTSTLPNLLVSGIPEVIAESPAMKVFVCNLMTKKGETDGYTASRFAREVCRYSGLPILDAVLVNSDGFPEALMQRYLAEGSHPVEVDLEQLYGVARTVLEAGLFSGSSLARHDSVLLASQLLRLLAANEQEDLEMLATAPMNGSRRILAQH